jgi:hypothetical protein
MYQKKALLTQWRANLAAILANRTTGWKQLVVQLGNKLLQREGEEGAAHVAYLLSSHFDAFAKEAESTCPMLLGLHLHNRLLLGMCAYVYTSVSHKLIYNYPPHSMDSYYHFACFVHLYLFVHVSFFLFIFLFKKNKK